MAPYSLRDAGAGVQQGAPGRASREDASRVDAARVERRSRRYALRGALRSRSSLERVAVCGLWRRPDTAAVSVVLGPDGAHLNGTQTCGSVWACPVCSASIRQGRALEVEAAARLHLEAGGSLVFVTLTLPHDSADRLGPLLDTVADGWKAVTQSRSYRRVRKAHGLDAIRAVEVTYGRNGWHPHVHALLFVGELVDDLVLDELRGGVESAWRRFVVGAGFRSPSSGHGVRWQPVALTSGADALARYLTKVQDGFGAERSVGLEMARGDLKRGRKTSRTPFDLLEAAAHGDRQAMVLWHQYEEATKGRRALTWSHGMKRRLGLSEVTDEDIAGAAVPGEVVAEFSEREWALVVRYEARARVLTAAEDRGAAGVWQVVAALERRATWDAERLRR